MDALKPLENKIAEVVKGLPPLPDTTKKMLADWAHVFVLIAGILQALVAIGLYTWGRDINKTADVINSYSNAFGVATSVEKLNIFYWASLIILVVDAVILLMAYAPLKAKSKKGWDLVFLSAVINFVYGFLTMFNNRGDFMSFVFSLVFTAAGVYLLFQVRDQFKPTKAEAKK